MGKYLRLFDTVSAYTEARENEYEEPWVSYTIENEGVNYNKTEREKLIETPLTFEITSDGVISWMFMNMGEDVTSNEKTIKYKKNDGEWTSITSTTGGTKINVVSGDTVQFKGDNLAYANMDNGGWANLFSGTTCQFNLKGNIMSLIDSDDFETLTTLACSATFSILFVFCTGLTSAENLILPATELTSFCYYSMFGYCISLTTVPKLPATTLADYCYVGIFNGCTSLVTAPQLPATTLAGSCYDNMFYNCTSLTTAPQLPATTLAEDCYNQMFYGCTNLTTAPELPATILTTHCYREMFRECTSLTTAPELPATTLADYCYNGMFEGCTSLNYIKAMFTTTPSDGYTEDWVRGVSSTGTFVKNSSAQWDVTGVDGIPTGWTVETA